MGSHPDIVGFAQGRDLHHFGDAADVGERGAIEIDVVVFDEPVEVPTLAPFLAGAERATRHRAQPRDILQKRLGPHGILDHKRLEFLDAAARSQRVGII